MARKLLTQSEYARRRGVSRQAIFKAVKAGRIQLVRGKIDAETADLEWQANTSPPVESTNGKEEASPTGLSYSTSRAIREAYIARLARLEYEQKVGTLIPADKVRLQAFNSARRARDLLLAIPDRIAAIVAGTTDEAECHRIITDEIHRVCDELSNATSGD